MKKDTVQIVIIRNSAGTTHTGHSSNSKATNYVRNYVQKTRSEYPIDPALSLHKVMESWHILTGGMEDWSIARCVIIS